MDFLITAFVTFIGLGLLGMASHGDPGFYEANTLPAWFKDFTERLTVLPGGITLNPGAFSRQDRVAVQTNGAAAQNATSITLDAIPGPLPAGSTINFTGGTRAVTSAAAVKGQTVVQVQALAAGIADNVAGVYDGQGKPFAGHGTLVGRTYAERAAKAQFEPYTDGDTEVYLLMHDYRDLLTERFVDVARPGALIAENFLPGWADRPAAEKAAIRAAYTTTIGQP